jgi:large subunit ribosomal protein L23
MNQERLLKVILSPHISEKATRINEKHNTQVFKVAADATKPEIKDAIEFLFNIKVKNVSTVNVRAKEKTFRGRQGFRNKFRKAYVTFQANQKLDLASGEK